MNIKKNITISLSEEDVKEIISDYLNRNGYEVKKENITFPVGSRLEGYGMAEHPVYYFKGACVSCNNE